MSDLNPTPDNLERAEVASDSQPAHTPKKSEMVYHPDYFRRQGKIWLVMALVLLLVWFVTWLFAKSPSRAELSDKPAAANILDVGNLPSSIETLGETDSIVPPINFDTVVRDLRSYPAEFKDKKYFNQHKNKWTVQVMDVAEHEVITDYLDGRPDRTKFAYFRYTDKNNQTRYILTYSVMNNFQTALGATRTVDFALPSSVRILPEEIKRYLDMMDNYKRAEEVADLQSNQPRMVDLQETTREIPPEPAKEEVATTPVENKENTAEETPLVTAPTAKPAKKTEQSADNQAENTNTRNSETMQEAKQEAQQKAEEARQNRRAESQIESNVRPTPGSELRQIPVEQAVPQQRGESQRESTPSEPTNNDSAE